MKFIHAADLHLDSPLRGLSRYEGAPVEELRGATRRALENLVALAKEEAVTFVLIAGDVYDGDWKDYNTGLFFASQMTELRKAFIKVFLIRGNHDARSQITLKLSLPDNVYEFSTRHPETIKLDEHHVAIHGQGFQNQAVSDDLSARYPAALPGYFNIGLLHTSATGRPGHENYAPCTIEGLQSKGYDYWALGHVHTREILSNDPYIVFPGNTQGRHVRETDSKGCMLVEIEDGEVKSLEHRPLDVLQWLHCSVDSSAASTIPELIELVRVDVAKQTNALDAGQLAAVRLTITGTFCAHREISDDPAQFENEIRLALNDFGSTRLWLEKLRLKTRPAINVEELVLRDDPMGQLLQFAREIPKNPDIAAELTASFSGLKLRLPQELLSGPDALVLEGTGFLTDLLTDVENDLLAALFDQEAAA